MSLLISIVCLFLVLQRTAAQETATPTIQPADLAGEDFPYQVIPISSDIPHASSSDNVSTLNKLGTWLYGYNGCKKLFGDGAKGKIDRAYYDAWLITNTEGVASNIDWNSAAALEYLGAPGLNKDEQSQIQAVLANAATVIYSNKNIFQHYLKVRCDDPLKRCQNRPDKDPCQPNPPNPDSSPKPTPLAYSTNSDKDDTKYPMINLCQGFFNRRGLGDAVKYGTALVSPQDLRLSNFDNRAQTFLHEMLHLDLAADSAKNNPHITDLQIDIKIGNRGAVSHSMAYGPLMTKILARWQGGNGLGSTGYWVQRSADNLAYYALARYVMTKNKNIYPHLPIITYEIAGPPYQPTPKSLVAFISDGGNLILNTTDDVQTFQKDWATVPGDDYPGCSDDANDYAASKAGAAISIDAFAPVSAYPADYNNQVSSWIAALNAASTTSTSSPTTTAAPLYAPGMCSFHLTETQDCEKDSKNLFAIINLKDDKGRDIGDTHADVHTDPIGEGINAGSSYVFASKLPNPIVVTGEHRHDYVQFGYGGLGWTSKLPNGNASCVNGGWDPKGGPICGQRFGNRNAVNNIDCSFPC